MREQPTVPGGYRLGSQQINKSSGDIKDLGTIAAAIVTAGEEQRRIIGIELLAYNDDMSTARPACKLGNADLSNGDPIAAGVAHFVEGTLAALGDLHVRNSADADNADAQWKVTLAPQNL
jgi:hypothetical protein